MSAPPPIASRPTASPPPGPLWREFARMLLLAVVLPVALVGLVLGWGEDRDRRAATGDRLASVTGSTARDIDEILDVQLAVVDLLAARRSAERNLDDVGQWQVDLAQLRQRYSGLSTMLVADADGTVVTSDPALPGNRRRSVADRAYFQQARSSGDSVVTGVFRGRNLGSHRLVAVSAPLWRDGAFAGVVQGSIRVDTLAQLRFDALQRRGYEVLLLDRDNRVIHGSAGLRVTPLERLAGDDPLLALATAAGSQPGDFAPATGMGLHAGVLVDDGDAYAVATPLRAGWRLLVLVPKEILDGEARRGMLLILGLLAAVMLGVLVIATLQFRRLGRSVQDLLERMRALAVDRAAPPVSPDSMPRELRALAESMNDLVERLAEADREVQHSLDEQRQLQRTLEASLGDREREIAERTRDLSTAVAELDRISRTDALTGCLNYRGLLQAIDRLWQAAVAGDRPLAALALDIDLFKSYNDRYGHQAGDHALERFAGAVRSALYSAADVLTRPGGEEFVVLLPETTLAQAQLAAARICAAVHRADIAHADGVERRLTVSIGIAARRATDGDDPQLMLARADDALYRAKDAGRNRVALEDPAAGV